MKRLIVFAMVVALSLVASGLLLAQSNSEVGTWKLNVAKSKYVNTPAPKNQTTTMAGDGSRIAYSFTTNYDGKDSPVSGVGAPGGEDTLAYKRVNANTTTFTAKKAGKVIRTSKSVVSKDGKVRTITSKGTCDGKPISTTTVNDKQ